jgi:hypothetical protein
MTAGHVVDANADPAGYGARGALLLVDQRCCRGLRSSSPSRDWTIQRDPKELRTLADADAIRLAEIGRGAVPHR